MEERRQSTYCEGGACIVATMSEDGVWLEDSKTEGRIGPFPVGSFKAFVRFAKWWGPYREAAAMVEALATLPPYMGDRFKPSLV